MARRSDQSADGEAPLRARGAVFPAALPFLTAILLFGAGEALGQRSGENAVTQADDAFGFRIGHESIGIYGAGNVRGFSPIQAGNVRIEGLYFDPAQGLTDRVQQSSSIKVGLSAQGYPFLAPTGIVDFGLRKPGDTNGVSVLASADEFGTRSIEADGTIRISPELSIGGGGYVGSTVFYNGTDNFQHAEGVIARWRPAPGVEIVPFWTVANDYNDEANTLYVPGGAYLPPHVPERHFDGPSWADIRYTGGVQGLVASVAPSSDWKILLGAFRSVADQKANFFVIDNDLQPDGSTDRLLDAEPRQQTRSVSGELRAVHSIADGPRIHTFYLSLRGRDRTTEYGGSDVIDYGPGQIRTRFEPAEPDFQFGPLSRDHIRQMSEGIAYDGRWRDMGELSLSVARTHYRKTTDIPGRPAIEAQASPLLYNATAAIFPIAGVAVYAGYARGLEESGVAPPNAVNRYQPLPAIRTRQMDGGVRIALPRAMKLILGAFDLRKPFFGFDDAGIYGERGDIRNQGVEFSLSGQPTPKLNVVAGGFLLRPRVRGDAGLPAGTGRIPVGLADRFVQLSANWQTPWSGLSLDGTAIDVGRQAGTQANDVFIPGSTQFNFGTRYRFKLAANQATIRVSMNNLTGVRRWQPLGPGAYVPGGGRFLQGYLTVDL